MSKKNMADKSGRAMRRRTPDTMGRAMVKKMNRGGPSALTPLPPNEPSPPPPLRFDEPAPIEREVRQRGVREAMRGGRRMNKGGMAYSSGGSVFRKAADGVATKGKTKGKMVKMAGGGYCK